jgi:streptogramin lyase
VSILGLLLALIAAAPATAAPAITGEFPVPGLGTNNKIVQGPDGNMWVTLEGGPPDVARITPAGAVTPYDIGAVTASGIAVGPEGRLWVTRNGGVTSFAPGNPVGTKVETTIIDITGNHSIVFGHDGNLWVATFENLIRIPPANPAGFKKFPIAGLISRDIDVAGPLLVIADFGGKRVLTATTADPPATTEYKLPGESQGVAGAPSGLIGYSQPGHVPEQVGLISPPTLLTPIETPGGGDPFGVALGSDNAFWFAMSANNGVARLSSTGQLTLLNGFAKESFPRQIASGPGNTLWVTLDMTDKVGRISGLEPPVTTVLTPPLPKEPRTRIDRAPGAKVTTTKKRARVRFRFSSPDAGSTFECRVRRLASKKTAKASKAPKFSACKSPKAYRLRPGRYRFEVRAVLAGRRDATPAKRGFRIVRVQRK